MDILIFFIGTIFGSFGSALINRIVKKDYVGFFIGRSKCIYCNNTLTWLELIPIFSYIFLRGKCRYCGIKISFLYFLLEIFTGIHFLLSYKFSNNILEFLFILIIGYFLILLSFADLWFYILIDEIYKILVIFTVIFVMFFNNWFNGYIFGILLFLIFYLIHIFSIYYVKFRYGYKAEGFGLGDALLALPIGIVLGIKYDISYILIYIILTSILGLIIYFIFYIFGNKGKSIPFLPAMVLGFFIMRFLYGFFEKIFY